MSMLEPRRLRLLVELAERGTITAVADAMHFTPSTVSHGLSALERDVGVALLERARPAAPPASSRGSSSRPRTSASPARSSTRARARRSCPS
jgi:hypothetical protein